MSASSQAVETYTALGAEEKIKNRRGGKRGETIGNAGTEIRRPP
jgi:hypothetical protein